MTKEFTRGSFVDSHTKAIPSLDEEHYLVHAGQVYYAFHVNETRNDGETIEVYFKSPPGRRLLHMLIQKNSALAATWYLYEGTTKTYVVGNKLTGLNRYRSKADSTLEACHTPGGSGDGTLILSGILGGSSGPSRVGGQSRTAEEILPKPDTAYLLRITSKAASNRLAAYLEYYERFHSTAATTTTTSTTTTSTTA